MKRIMCGVAYGFFALCVPTLIVPLVSPKGVDTLGFLGPKLGLLYLLFFFVIGFIAGILDYNRKQRKREEEEERQAEQEETNRLMREYLEKKLREENKKD